MKDRNEAQGIIFAAGLATAVFAVVLALWLRAATVGATFNTIRLLPDLALLVLLLALSVVVAARAPRSGVGLALVICIAWALAICSQMQFFLHTGYFASRPLIAYAAGHASNVSSVATSGLDAGFGFRIALAMAIIGLACSSKALTMGLQRSRATVGSASASVLAALVFIPPNVGALSGPLLNSGFSEDLPPVSHPMPIYVAPTVGTPTRAIKTPNIVVWIVESGRADLIDRDNPLARPIFLNKLARESLVFERAYTTTTHTSKALVGILCGHYPHPRMEILESVPGRFPMTCLPHLLGKLGYTTYFLQAALGAFENRRGLTENLGFQNTIVQEDLPATFVKAGYFGMDERALLDPLSDIASKSKDGPVFITLLTNLTHHPYALPGYQAPDEAAPFAYGTMVEYVDDFLADAYQRMGAYLDWDNTLLIVLGDHGEAFAEHGLQQHDSVSYEEVVRIPLFIRFPKQIAPNVDTTLRQTVDLLPSVLEMIGLEWSGTIAGESMFAGPRSRPVVTTCWPTRTCHSVVFENGMKVVYYFGPRKEEVYSLAHDPRERADLSSNAGASDLVFEAAREIARVRSWAEEPFKDVEHKNSLPATNESRR